MDREKALSELKVRLSNENIIKHSLAVEAIMREIAVILKEDVENWGLAGLLHDIDYELTKDNPAQHSIVAAKILEDMELDGSIIYAVKAHNAYHGIKRKRKMDKVLYAADPMSGLITAAALILPNKKIADVTLEFLFKRFNETSFAKGANREQIKECEESGFSLEDFMEISLRSMKIIAKDLGL